MSTDKRAEARIKRSGFFWNAMCAGLSAIQSAIILFAVSRTLKLSDAGVVTIGFTIANLAMIVANYGIRHFQVTDVHEQYSFTDYFHGRLITVLGSLAISVGYLALMLFSGRYSGYKALVILEIVFLKLMDSFEGLYIGRLQQKGRLDVGSRIATIRLSLSTLAIFVSLWFIKDIVICFLIGILTSVVVEVILLPGCRNYADCAVGKARADRIKQLLRVGIPLCVGTALHNYIGNAPKYLVDFFLTDEIQAVSGYIMMPMFVITVLNQFLMQPAVKDLGDTWDAGDGKRFRRLIARHVALISGLAVFVLVAGVFIGLPLLTWMYRVDLNGYRREFLYLILGGTFHTLSAYLIVLLTTIRRQGVIVLGCAAALIIFLAFGKMMLSGMGFMGAAVLYIIANAVMLAVFIAGVIKHGAARMSA